MGSLKFKIRELKIPFRFTFAHNRMARSSGSNVILEIHYPSGQIGYGETLYRSYLTAENFESIVEDLNELTKHLIEFDFINSNSPKDFLNKLYDMRKNQRNNASFCAFDLAVYDLHAKLNNRSISSYFTGPRVEKKITVPIGFKMPFSLIVIVAKLFGFKEFKIKVNSDSLPHKLRLIDHHNSDGFDFRIDANETWNETTIIPALKQIPSSISSVEQPTSPQVFETCYIQGRNAHLCKKWVADESLITLNDALNLAKLDRNIIWNLRLAKNGGYTGVQRLIDLAEDHGVEYQLGVLVGETGLLASALAIFAGFFKCKHLEFGFNVILLKTNPFKNPPFPIKGTSRWYADSTKLFSRSKSNLEKITIKLVEF